MERELGMPQIIDPVETPVSDDKETIRTFGFFRDEEHPEREVAVKHIGSFDEVLQKAAIHSMESFHGARQIVEMMKDARVSTLLPEGGSIEKRPHILIAGGFVRDALMGKEPKDLDFATNLTYEELEQVFQDRFAEQIANGSLTFQETGKQFGVARVQFRNNATFQVTEEYEIATFRQDGTYSDGRRPDFVASTRHAGYDADRRDITINALFYNPLSGNIIDYVGGLKDAEEHKLRFVGSAERRIAEDTLRMLRYIRFLTKTGFEEDPEAKAAIQKYGETIRTLPSERIKDELDKTFDLGNVGTSLEFLKEYGLLKDILPEVDSLSACEQGPPYHMEGDVFRHTVMVANGIPNSSSRELKWAAIFHDIGKPDTKAVARKDGKEKVSFLQHEEPSTTKARQIMNRLKFTGAEQLQISWLVQNHIRAFSFPELRESKAREFAASSYFAALIDLATADTNASIPIDEAIYKESQETMRKVRERYQQILAFTAENKTQLDANQKLTNGNIIIERYKEIHGQPPQGPLIGNIQRQAREQIVERNLSDSNKINTLLDEIILQQGTPIKT